MRDSSWGLVWDRAIDQVQAKERPKTPEDVQVEIEIAEMDREPAEIQTPPTETGAPETPATRGHQAPDIAPETISPPKGVRNTPT